MKPTALFGFYAQTNHYFAIKIMPGLDITNFDFLTDFKVNMIFMGRFQGFWDNNIILESIKIIFRIKAAVKL